VISVARKKPRPWDGAKLFIGVRGSLAKAAVVDTKSLTVNVNLPGTSTGHNAVSANGRFAFIAIVGRPAGVAIVDLHSLSLAAFYRYPAWDNAHGLIFEPDNDGDTAE